MGELFEKAIAEIRKLPPDEQRQIGFEIYMQLNSGSWKPLYDPIDDRDRRIRTTSSYWTTPTAAQNVGKGQHLNRVPGSKRLVWRRSGFHYRWIGTLVFRALGSNDESSDNDLLLWFWSGRADDYEKLLAES